MKIAFSFVDNCGGMRDVVASYLRHFQSHNTPHLLIVFTDDLSRIALTHPPNVFYFPVNDLYQLNLSENEKTRIKKTICTLLENHSIDTALCDYATCEFFQDFKLKIVADIHYLIAASNRSRSAVLNKDIRNSFFKTDSPIDQIGFYKLLLKKEKLERQLLRRADYVIANSNSTREDIQKLYGNYIDQNKILVCPVNKSVARIDSVDFYTRDRIALYHGRFNWTKGIHFLPKIAETIQIPLFMVGAQKNFSEVVRLDLPKNLHLVDWIEHDLLMKNFVNKATFHFFPSIYEPFGLALTKSLRSGAICIANQSAGGHREQIAHGINGFLLDFNHANFSSRLAEIISIPKPELKQISDQAIQISQSAFDYVEQVIMLLTTATQVPTLSTMHKGLRSEFFEI